MQQRTSRFSLVMAIASLLILAGSIALAQFHRPVEAQNAPGTDTRHITYFPQGRKTMANTTPVASQWFCGQGDQDIFNARLTVQGTMTGTGPSVAVKWQESFDQGTTVADVGSWVTINATAETTPANLTQSQTVAEIANNSTAVAYGDCWRALYTFGGTGTVTADFGMTGYSEGD